MVTMSYFCFILIFYKDLQKYDIRKRLKWSINKKAKTRACLDLYFNQNKTYHEIAKIARISPRDIKPIIDKAYQDILDGKKKNQECLSQV
jgi:DNA-directed RNA polymerase specialized sigma subunit